MAQQADDGGDDSSSQGTGNGDQQTQTTAPKPRSASTPASSSQALWPGHIPLPDATPDANANTTADTNSSFQVTSPSVTLPTPALPSPTPLVEPTPSPTPEQTVIPLPTPAPVFNPPSASVLNLPSAQPAGNPSSAPASSGLPNMTLDDASSEGPGVLGGMFDWAKKLRFQAAVRGGFDNNVNSANGTTVVDVSTPVLVTNQVTVFVPVSSQVTNMQATNTVTTLQSFPVNVVTQTNVVSKQTNGSPVIASEFVNLNGGVNYRFGVPRLSVSVGLTGGVTRYLNSDISQPLQGTMGLGIQVQYRFSPRMVFTFNSSSSYQQQPNITLVGTPTSGNAAYYYTSDSFAGAYQWSDLFTTVTRFDEAASYYPNQPNQGFTAPSFTQTLRYLVRPTTTAVLDGTANYYGYGNSGSSSSSLGGVIDFGFDHVFNPKWFWNFRLGAQYQSGQSSANGSSSYFGPYLDSNFSWILSKNSSVSWVARYSTQPSGQSTSYVVALSSGFNFSQGIFTKLTFNTGIFYLLNQYPTSGLAPSYNQTNVQASASLNYKLNRIVDITLGYQYLTATSTSALSQNYNRDITYLQVNAGF